jgi:VanZ family protein
MSRNSFLTNTWFWSIIGYMIFLLFVSISPTNLSGRGHMVKQVLHNLGHIPAYMVFTLLWIQLLRGRRIILHVYVLALTFAMSYGGFMEFLQSMTPGRTAALSDCLLNSLGGGIAIWLDRKGIFLFLKKLIP